MIFDYIALTAGILIISFVQYFESILYLKFSEAIIDPKSIESRIKIFIGWFVVVGLMVLNCILTVNFVNYLGLGFPSVRALGGAAPIILGLVPSFILKRQRWSLYQKKFNN